MWILKIPTPRRLSIDFRDFRYFLRFLFFCTCASYSDVNARVFQLSKKWEENELKGKKALKKLFEQRTALGIFVCF